MDLKSLKMSTEVITGMAMIVVGLLAQHAGMNGLLAVALPPFGLGLILCDVLLRFGRAAREAVKVRVRRDR